MFIIFKPVWRLYAQMTFAEWKSDDEYDKIQIHGQIVPSRPLEKSAISQMNSKISYH